PLSKLHGADENRASELRPILNALTGLAVRTGAAVVVIHHDKKPSHQGHDSVITSGRGSISIAGEADYIVRVPRREDSGEERQAGELRFTLEADGRYPPTEPRMGTIRFLPGGAASLELVEVHAAQAEARSEADRELEGAILATLPAYGSAVEGRSQ